MNLDNKHEKSIIMKKRETVQNNNKMQATKFLDNQMFD